MAEQTNFVDQAKRRWSHSRIEGSGPYAAVLGCSYRVVLCTIPLQASMLVNQPCGQHCSHRIAPDGNWHQLVELEKPTVREFKRPSWAAEMQRD
jgi:hypothetical protein